METSDIMRFVCLLIFVTTAVGGPFDDFNSRLYPRGDLLDLGDSVFPDDSGKGFTFNERSPPYRFEPTKYFEKPTLPLEFSIAAVFTPKSEKAFLFALLGPDAETIRMGLSINKTQAIGVTSKAVYEIFFWYNDDVSKYGYKPPVVKAVVPDFLDNSDSVQWRIAVYVNRTRVSIYWDCKGQAPEIEASIKRLSMNNGKPFFEEGSSMYVMSGGPVYEAKFKGSVQELRMYKGKTGVSQRCTNFKSWPTDDSDGVGSGLEENKMIGNVFKKVTTTTEKMLPVKTTIQPNGMTKYGKGATEKPLATKDLTKGKEFEEIKPLTDPRNLGLKALSKEDSKPPQTEKVLNSGCDGDIEDSNLQDSHRPPCRKNFLKTSTTTTTTTTSTTTTTTTTPKPTTTTKPTTTPKPTTTTKPTTTPEPTTTTEATTTPEPTTTMEPTTTPEPTTTVEPTTTPEPTTTMEPTTTPEPTTTVQSSPQESKKPRNPLFIRPPTTVAPKKCSCKGVKGDIGPAGPPGPPGKGCKVNRKKKMEAGGEWILLPDTTQAPQAPVGRGGKGEKGDRGLPGMKGVQGERGLPGLPCKPPPGGRVMVKGGKVKFVEGAKEWQLLDTTTAPPKPTLPPRPVKGPKGAKGDRGAPGLPCQPPPGGRVLMKGGRVKVVEGDREWDLLNTTKPVVGAPGPKGIQGQKGEPGKCPKCNLVGRPGPKGKDGVCTKPCQPGTKGEAGRPGPKGESAAIDSRKVESMVRDIVLNPGLKSYFQGPKGENGKCNNEAKNGAGCPLEGGGCVNKCNRGPPGPPGPPGVGLDKLGSFGYGAITFPSTKDFYDVAIHFPTGSIVYVDRAENGRPMMLIKVDGPSNGWREMRGSFGALQNIPVPMTTAKPTAATPANIVGRDVMRVGRMLYLVALDFQMRGNMGDLSGNGHAMAERMCEMNARAKGLEGDFGVVLGHEYLQLRSLVASEDFATVPIVNIKNQVLYNSWKDFLGGARMNPEAPLLTFEGKNVLKDIIAENKKVWLGSDQTGKTSFTQTPTCRLWTSGRSRKFGLAGDLISGHLMNVKPIPCSQNAFVLCIKTNTKAMMYRRKK